MSDHHTKIRYHKRAVDDDGWIRSFLKRMPLGQLAIIAERYPYLVNNLFVYVEPDSAIYMHTAQVGRLRQSIESGGQVCFSIARMGRLLPDEKPVDFDVEYESVIVFGQASLVENAGEKERILQLLLDKYAPHLHPGLDYQDMPASDINRTSVYCITIEGWSGKRNQAPDDFPGAFFYQNHDQKEESAS